MYANSLIILLIGSVFIIPLVILKGFSKYSIPLFYLAVIAATLYRPTSFLGTDNENFIMSLENHADYGAEAFKYAVVHYLTFLIPGTWQKIVTLNLLSSTIVIFSFRKIFKQIKKKSNFRYIYLLYMSYFLNIAPLLILVHVRQYLAFALTTLLLILYRSKRGKDIFYELLISLLIFFVHPVYSYFAFFYFICKYFLRNLIYIKNKTTLLSKFLIFLGSLFPVYLLIQNIEKLFVFIAFSLPGFDRYGLSFNEIPTSNEALSTISTLYPLILIIPPILIRTLGKKKDKNDAFFSIIIIYLLFTIPLIILEIKASFLYSIGRIKSAIYPATFLLFFHIEEEKLNQISILAVASFSIFLSVFSIYRAYKYT